VLLLVGCTTNTDTSQAPTDSPMAPSKTAAPLVPVITPAPASNPTSAATPPQAEQPTPQVIVIQQPASTASTDQPQPPAPSVSVPVPPTPTPVLFTPIPTPTAEPSSAPQWSDCQSTWQQGTDVAAIQYQSPGLWGPNYEREKQNFMDYDQTYCVGIGSRLVHSVGSTWCNSMLAAAATQQLLMKQIHLLQSLYFPARQLAEMNGYIAEAGC